MIQLIINYLNLTLSTLNYWGSLACLCEIKGDSKGVEQPQQYVGQGQWSPINFNNSDGYGYWRLRGEITSQTVDNRYAVGKRVTRSFPLRFVFAVRRSKLTFDDAYAFARIVQTVEAAITADNGPLIAQIGAARVTIRVTSSNGDAKAVWESETKGTKTLEPQYELVYGAIDVDVDVTADIACFANECDNVDTDILHAFNFCDAAVRDRLTDAQVACLEAALCETPEHVTLTINGTSAGSEPSGGAFDISVTLDGTESGAWNEGAQTWEVESEPCNPVRVDINSTIVGTPASGDYFFLTVTLDGSPSGSWNGVDTWEVTSDPCEDATITINSSPYGSAPSGGTTNIIVESEANTPLGSLVGGNWEVGNAHLRVNGTTVGNLEPEQWHDHYATINGTQAGTWHNASQTWQMNVLQSGSPVGSLSGTDWVIPASQSLSLAASTTTPAYGASVTITATPTGITPISYSFTYQTKNSGTRTTTTQAGASLAITAIGYGATVVTVTATDGSTTVGATITLTIAQMAEVTTFLSATGIVDATITSAVRTLALDLQDYGLWSKMRALYPFVGGTATTHKFNLKNAVDSDAGYRLIFAGGWTHNSNGATGNGTNTSADSRLANNVPGQNSLSLGVYNRTAGTGGVEWSGSSSPRTWLAANISGTAYYNLNNSASTATTTAPASVLGTLIASRVQSSDVEINRNGQGQRVTVAASSAPSATNFILGQFSGGGFNTARNYAAAFISDGLTAAEEVNMHTALQAFNTTLGRNV